MWFGCCPPIGPWPTSLELAERRQDASVLISVSRDWRAEAERYMYSSVCVPNGNILFCRTIVDRPDLARRVRLLIFNWEGHRPQQPGDFDLVARALRSLVNLTSLSINRSNTCCEYGREDCLCVFHYNDVRILRNVPFSLERFSATFCWNQELIEVLEEHPNIKEFSLNCFVEDDDLLPVIPDNLLQNCERLAFSSNVYARFPNPPKAKHVELSLVHLPPLCEAQAAASMSLFRDSLTTLIINRSGQAGDEYLAPYQILAQLAKGTPNLTILGIYDKVEYTPRDNKRILDVVSENWPQLKVFIWAPNRDSDSPKLDWATSEWDGFSTDTDVATTSEEKTVRFAKAVLAAKPSLDLFIAQGWGRQVGMWERCKIGEGRETIARLMSSGHYPLRNLPDYEIWRWVDDASPSEYFEYTGYPVYRFIEYEPGISFFSEHELDDDELEGAEEECPPSEIDCESDDGR
ncbi:hypothetical protein OF83DRAFT_1066428 [Amylostereum chailletii]|nr:hypothetical protein OF83DRAFT_1066428 [Amylostereum chailletii]